MRTTEFTEYKRVIALDVLRGLAILGTLLTNITIFASIDMVPSTDDTVNTVISRALSLVTDGKFIGLLTIMFGIGLEIQRQSAIRKGQSWPGTYPIRAGLLILDGVLNYVFIFEFDVLMGYGLTALVIAAVTARSPRAQKIWMWVALVVHVSAMIAVGVLTQMNREGLKEAGQQAMAEYTHSSYWGDVAYRLDNFFLMRMEIPVILLMGAALYLVGVHLYRAGIFAPEGARLRKIVMCLSFGIGLPLDWTLRLLQVEAAAPLVRYVTSASVSIGLLAAVAAFYVRRDRLGPLGRMLSDVGRMALTCYLAQNLIASFVFYDYGLGMARVIQGPWSQVYTLAIYALIAAFLVMASRLWLSFHARGPVELVWHRSYDLLASRYLRWKAARSQALPGGQGSPDDTHDAAPDTALPQTAESQPASALQ
ncbi:DUF418 domain-containing protein [Actinomyces slackii]|uniref:Predicted membrane protein n=1 Tax=Actinomyces slackii TaxID=52774 RepID=A0A3S5EMD7_9ACTO|nr:DUF418 domain-containing protein [Actinomyces slackii]VEG75893.1 Predicted membrane protein [Actinomyces slackii]